MSSKKDMRRADLGEWSSNYFKSWFVKANVEKRSPMSIRPRAAAMPISPVRPHLRFSNGIL